MPDRKIQSAVQQSVVQSVGNDRLNDDVDNNGIGITSWLVRAGDFVPPWWSPVRDRQLADVWKSSNHLSAAVYNTQARIVGIPPRIVPKDTTNAAHWEEAAIVEQRLITTAGFGVGWWSTYGKFIESLITQDNGAFMEIIGGGDPAGPIIGAPISVRHLASNRCTRTNNPMFPVVYTDDHGARFKLHWTRIIAVSQMPSQFKEMNGVGFSAVSRCLDIAQTLVDMIRYKQERLGSRPPNKIVVGKGITARQIMLVLRQAEEQMSNRGLTRYARTIALGSENTDIGLDTVDLNHLDPFDEETSTNLGMFAIAMAFGMDADELWPVGGKSAGKQEANIKRQRSRGKLPTQITSEMATQFNFKVLPPHLKLIFDFKDDDEDMQRANIRDIRARNRERDLGDGAINVRAARTRMLDSGDMSRQMFRHIELTDGRLLDGRSISILYFTDDPVYNRLLRFMDDPLDTVGNIKDIDIVTGTSVLNDAKLDTILSDIQLQRQIANADLARTKSGNFADKIEQSLFALDWLEEQYNFAAGRLLPPVPMGSRRQRTDVRVAPQEVSPEGSSPAQNAMVQSENITQVGGQ